MKSRDFCYWLQGYFEISDSTNGKTNMPLNEKQVAQIKAHLAMVFKHEIDPEAGSSEHQDNLNHLHGTNTSDFIARC